MHKNQIKLRHENVLFLRNVCEALHIRSIHPKWALSTVSRQHLGICSKASITKNLNTVISQM